MIAGFNPHGSAKGWLITRANLPVWLNTAALPGKLTTEFKQNVLAVRLMHIPPNGSVPGVFPSPINAAKTAGDGFIPVARCFFKSGFENCRKYENIILREDVTVPTFVV